MATTTALPFPLLPRVDGRTLVFSLSSYLAAAITLLVAFAASLPRPWWALLTVYVTAQPMAGAFRPKVIYRLIGIGVGAVTTLALVPNLQNSPELLVLCLASWTGLCITLAVLDRSPRAFVFQMAAFSSAVISFPYLDDPSTIFDSTVARVEEMTVAILTVTAVHALIQPWSATPLIKARIERFCADAGEWAAEAISAQHTRLEHTHRRDLAAHVTEIGMIALHLPFDDAAAPATRRRVIQIQHQLTEILPLASGAANRLDLLRQRGDLPEALEAVRTAVVGWLREEGADAADLVARCRALADDAATDLMTASAAARMAALVEALAEARAQAHAIGSPAEPGDAMPHLPFSLARDHGLALIAGLATASAIMLYCAVWIGLGWPNGSATAAFAALITCSFSAQDDPAPAIGRYLIATLKTFPLAAFYLFVVLPRVDGWGMLVIVLAPALVWMGMIQADPQRSPQALPMFSCFIVAMGFLARFQGDFALFLNTGLAQVGGIVATLVVTRLYRSVGAQWTARRMVRANWAEMARLADIRRPFTAEQWTARATDRLGQIAARMALAGPDDHLHAADGLIDLRIGRTIIPVRAALAHLPYAARHRVQDVLGDVSRFFLRRWRAGAVVPPGPELAERIDAALMALLPLPREVHCREAIAALVAMRCNLIGDGPPA